MMHSRHYHSFFLDGAYEMFRSDAPMETTELKI